MNHRRAECLIGASGLALLSVTLAFCLGTVFSPEPSVQPSSSVLAASEVSFPQQTQTSTYLIQSVDGEVCILQGDQILLHTGVNVSLLPRQDREALKQGIPVESREELAALLEDMTS